MNPLVRKRVGFTSSGGSNPASSGPVTKHNARSAEAVPGRGDRHSLGLALSTHVAELAGLDTSDPGIDGGQFSARFAGVDHTGRLDQYQLALGSGVRSVFDATVDDIQLAWPQDHLRVAEV